MGLTRKSHGLLAQCILIAFGREHEDLDRDAMAHTAAVWLAATMDVLIRAHTEKH